jgi:hypothetical protein
MSASNDGGQSEVMYGVLETRDRSLGLEWAMIGQTFRMRFGQVNVDGYVVVPGRWLSSTLDIGSFSTVGGFLRWDGWQFSFRLGQPEASKDEFVVLSSDHFSFMSLALSKAVFEKDFDVLQFANVAIGLSPAIYFSSYRFQYAAQSTQQNLFRSTSNSQNVGFSYVSMGLKLSASVGIPHLQALRCVLGIEQSLGGKMVSTTDNLFGLEEWCRPPVFSVCLISYF